MAEEFECDKCKKTFTRKSNLTRHCASSCPYLSNDDMKKFSCKHCGESFTRKYNLAKHIEMKNCKSRKKSKRNDKIEGLVSFTTDGIDNLDSEDIEAILDDENSVLYNIIVNVNLNPRKPQHHNILFDNHKSSYGQVFRDDSWVILLKNEILDALIAAKVRDLKKISRDFDLKKRDRSKIDLFLAKMEKMKDIAYRRMRRQLKSAFMSYRNLVSQTRKLMKKKSGRKACQLIARAESKYNELHKKYLDLEKENAELRKRLLKRSKEA